MSEEKPMIYVVDDNSRNQRLLQAMLKPMGYEVALASGGQEVLDNIHDVAPDIILLDIMMPEMDGYEVARRLKSASATRHIPIVMVTALREVNDRVMALESGADDFLSKPVEKVELKARVQSLLKVKAYNDNILDYKSKLETEVEKRSAQLHDVIEKLKKASLDTIFRLTRAAEFKDEDTAGHIQRMSHYAVTVAEKIGMQDAFVEQLLYAAPMHDVGKIGVPDRILLKNGPLDDEEWVIMRKHTEYGTVILSNSDSEFLRMGEIVAGSHHEKWDGKGYPGGLSGKDIPIEGRITAIADVFDALTSKRPYKEPFSVEKSLQIIQEGRGSHFDPQIVDAFMDSLDKIQKIKERYIDDEESLLYQMAT